MTRPGLDGGRAHLALAARYLMRAHPGFTLLRMPTGPVAGAQPRFGSHETPPPAPSVIVHLRFSASRRRAFAR